MIALRAWAVASAMLIAAGTPLPAPVLAQATSNLSAARAAGTVGERYDGYLGFAATPPETVRRQVGAVNIRRRNLYIGVAARRRVSPQTVGIAAGCELLARVAVGHVYMLSDGIWRRRLPGQPAPRPTHCPA